MCRLDYWSGHGRTNRTVCYGPVVKWSGGFLCPEGYLRPGESGGEVLYSATGLSTSLTPDGIPMLDGIATLCLSTSFVRLCCSDCVIVVDTSLSDCACSLPSTGQTITGLGMTADSTVSVAFLLIMWSTCTYRRAPATFTTYVRGPQTLVILPHITITTSIHVNPERKFRGTKWQPTERSEMGFGRGVLPRKF